MDDGLVLRNKREKYDSMQKKDVAQNFYSK